MTTRRELLTAVGGVGFASICGQAAGAEDAGKASEDRELYELRRYAIATEEQKHGLDAFLKDAAIPAWNRIGVSPVGVFYPEKDLSPVYVLLRHHSAESMLHNTHKLLSDAEYLNKGAKFLNAPADKPAFQRMESGLFLAFKGMPELATPVKSPGRVFQLRTYESPSVKTGQKKIEMFNDAGEIAIFRRVGLHAVFFGEALVGAKMPNLTYMLVFESPDELKANWSKFGSDPGWRKLRTMAEYSDKAILCGITNLILKPADYSQI
ncbi:MAG: NIPSNAP family protein [Isosphaeraceae bacterium]